MKLPKPKKNNIYYKPHQWNNSGEVEENKSWRTLVKVKLIWIANLIITEIN